MIDKLTKPQEKLIKQTRDEWLNRFFSCKNRTNRKQATKYINWLYELAGLKNPLIIFLDSPLGIQYGANMLKNPGRQVRAQVGDQVRDQVRAQVGDQVRDQVRDQVWAQVRDQVGDQVWAQVGDQVRDQVWAQVRDQVWAQVRDQVGDQVWDQVRDQVWDQKLETFSFAYYGSVWDYGWVAFYEYFHSIGVKYPKDLLEKFNNFAFLLKSNVYDMIQFENVCIVSDMPTVIKRDAENRLHNQEGAAIEFKDGYKLYFYHGMAVPEEWIANPEKLTKKDWSEEANTEKRRVIQELMGDKFPKKIGCKLIGKPSKEFKEKHNLLGLYEVELPSDPDKVAHYIRVKDHSTTREYYLRVPATEFDADAALAWTFGKTKEEYRPIQET